MNQLSFSGKTKSIVTDRNLVSNGNGFKGADNLFVEVKSEQNFYAAITHASISTVNNQGDINKTLNDLGKSESLKGIVTAAVTAGAMETVNPGWAKQLNETSQLSEKAMINLTNSAVSATVKTAIQGGSYEDNLKTALLSAGVDTAAGWAAANLGEGYKNGSGALSELQGQYLAHKVAHALVGCASASAKNSSCAAGAMGGAMGEAFAEMYAGTIDGSTLTPERQQEVLNMTKLATAAAATLSGKDAQVAVDAATNAVVNNFLIQYKLKGMASAYVDDEFAPILEKWIELAKSKGVEIKFNEAFRSTEYQSSLSTNPFAITPAKAGSSLHEAGFAVDVNFERLTDIPGGLTKKEQQQILLDSAKQAGLSWGGNFSKPDFPHFYFDPGSRTQKILEAQTTYCNLTKKCEK